MRARHQQRAPQSSRTRRGGPAQVGRRGRAPGAARGPARLRSGAERPPAPRQAGAHGAGGLVPGAPALPDHCGLVSRGCPARCLPLCTCGGPSSGARSGSVKLLGAIFLSELLAGVGGAHCKPGAAPGPGDSARNRTDANPAPPPPLRLHLRWVNRAAWGWPWATWRTQAGLATCSLCALSAGCAGLCPLRHSREEARPLSPDWAGTYVGLPSASRSPQGPHPGPVPVAAFPGLQIKGTPTSSCWAWQNLAVRKGCVPSSHAFTRAISTLHLTLDLS